MKGALIDKPAAVFTSTGSLHGGQEATLLGMMIPLLHHGMLLMGLPYDSDPNMLDNAPGGTPYGPSHIAGPMADQPLVMEERKFCMLLGQRMSKILQRLSE